MTFAIVGFEQGPLFRWSALLGAIDHFGGASFKLGVIANPNAIGTKLVCARVQDFGIIFTPDEVDRLGKTMKKTKAEFPKFAWRILESVQGAANDARYASDAEKRKMI